MPTTATQHWKDICSAATLTGRSFALMVGDARDCLRLLPSASIQTCLTSPPYWGARDYSHPSQIGSEAEVTEYVCHVVNVFNDVKRVLVDEGTVWLNIGDRYVSGAPTENGLPPLKGWKRNKQLSLTPFRLALALQEDGWWIRNVVAWHKPNAMPSSVTDRLTNTWEPFFLLTKSEQYFFELDKIRVPHKTDDSIERRRAENGAANGKAKGNSNLRRWLNSPRHRATIDGFKEVRVRPQAPEAVELAAYLKEAANGKGISIKDVAVALEQPFERVRHYFRTDKIGSRLPPEETWFQLKALLDLDDTYDEAMTYLVKDNVFRNHPKGRNPGDVLSVSLRGEGDAHYAVMPLPLAEWALRATLPKGGLCLDPFMGLGTTGLAALNLGGKFVGIDVREDYVLKSEQRITIPISEADTPPTAGEECSPQPFIDQHT